MIIPKTKKSKMFLPLIISDEAPTEALEVTLGIWAIVAICFIILTIIFRKQLKKLNKSEKTAFIIFAIIGFIILGCMGYAIITGICALYGAKRDEPKKEKVEYEYDIPGKHYNEPQNSDKT